MKRKSTKRNYFTSAWRHSDEEWIGEDIVAAPLTVYSPDDTTVNTGLVDHLGNPILYIEEYNSIGFYAEISD